MRLDILYDAINKHLRGTYLDNDKVKLKFIQMGPSAPLSKATFDGEVKRDGKSYPESAIIEFNLDSHML